MNKELAINYIIKLVRAAKDKIELYTEYGLPINGIISPNDWVLTIALLTGKKRISAKGPDLEGEEGKSGCEGNAFEYQYHCNTWEDKLKQDKEATHWFISYSPNYKRIVIRRVSPDKMRLVIGQWEDDVRRAYAGSERRQRCRKSVTYDFVKENGEIILEIQEIQD